MYIFFLSSGYTTGTNLVTDTVSPWIQIIHNKTLWLHHKIYVKIMERHILRSYDLNRDL